MCATGNRNSNSPSPAHLAQVHPQATTPVPRGQAFPCSEDLLHVNRAGHRSPANEWGARRAALSRNRGKPHSNPQSSIVNSSGERAHAIVVGAPVSSAAGNGGVWRAGRPWLPKLVDLAAPDPSQGSRVGSLAQRLSRCCDGGRYGCLLFLGPVWGQSVVLLLVLGTRIESVVRAKTANFRKRPD